MPNNNTRTPSEQGLFSRSRGIDMEDMAYHDLIVIFHEIFVHDQPRKRKLQFDFIVYAQNKTFAIDVFFSVKKENMMNQAKEKIKAYNNFGQIVYIVQMNAQLNGNIQQLAPQAKQNIGLFDYDEFINEIKNKHKPLNPPKDYHEFDLSDISLLKRIKNSTNKKGEE